MLLGQRGISQVVEMGIAATLRLVGIGSLEADAYTLSTGMVEREEFESARRAGAAGEILGHMFNAAGKRIESDLSARTLSMDVAAIGKRATVAIAGGSSKVKAIKAALASGLLHGLITDERTARALAA